MKVVTWLLLPLAGLLLAADGSPTTVNTAERARILSRFEHGEHRRALEREGLGCVSCHQVGARAESPLPADEVDQVLMIPPAGACHFCHVPASGERGRGPRTCTTCHDGGIMPEDHRLGWATDHGAEARLQGRACYDCHRRSTCVNCHERKDPARYRVHDRAWLSVHGIAVQADPSACGTCHLQADCVSCHASGSRVSP